MSKKGIALVAAEFNRGVVDSMVAAARDEAAAANVAIVVEARVPGCYETPLIVDRLLARRDVEVVVVLGYIERGDTQHGEVMGQVVHAALTNASLTYGKPVGLGLIGPGATAEQAEARKDPYARAAVRAALAQVAALAAVAPRKKKR
ncbi:MAG TPA: 6,7-dimethyl-8-ribityllumazine synthase [Byssovorax sp.]